MFGCLYIEKIMMICTHARIYIYTHNLKSTPLNLDVLLCEFFPCVSMLSLSLLHSILLYWGAREKISIQRQIQIGIYMIHTHSFISVRTGEKMYRIHSLFFPLAPKFLSVDVRKPTQATPTRKGEKKSQPIPPRARECFAIFMYFFCFCFCLSLSHSHSLSPIHHIDVCTQSSVLNWWKKCSTHFYIERRI